ncbi:LuxR C-terminal-related transcriptional regulator [Kribbella sp. NPDC058245]|uniref:LuxR C-terminal-related transcriptional regulator n=1 Tax=Kribbella sp. NPDC058245 TaxID=3346399 RepID=UPI0036EAFB20
MFESLGLSEQNLAVYRALLKHPELVRTSMAGELSRAVGLSVEEVTEQVAQLRILGLLVPRWNIDDEDYPLHPADGFELLTKRRQQEIDQLSARLDSDRVAAGEFVASYSEFLVEKSIGGVEVHEGERAYQRMQHFHPAKSVWGMVSPDPGGIMRDPKNTADSRFLEHGIKLRYLIVEAQLKVGETREFCANVQQFGAEVRVVPSVPLRMVIFDAEAVVVGIDPDNRSPGAMVHHSRSVVRIAIDLYEHYWRRARPYSTAPPADAGEITGQESEFLRFLVQGATDEQVARKLGVSMRTVRRMAAKLSEQVGASGRFELGVRAAQRGWVD